MKNLFFYVPGRCTAIMLHWHSLPRNRRGTLVHFIFTQLLFNSTPLYKFLRVGFFFCAVALLWQNAVFAQLNTDNQFARPLKEVLQDVQNKYGVTIKFTDSMVANKKVTYAAWKYRPDVDVTLENILTPLELKVKKEAEKKYKLSAYEYYRWQPADGWAELDRIASQYSTLQEWENRKSVLKPCLREALQLTHLPALPGNKPIITPVRNFEGYTVENIAIEILPGLWINGSLYKPAKYKGKIPVILNPDGHWEKQRYRPDCQYRCAAFAKMGAMAFSYDLFAWGESLLQFKYRRSPPQFIYDDSGTGRHSHSGLFAGTKRCRYKPCGHHRRQRRR